ncbi:MAG: B12-binding domain-containing radical SAM protein [Magnetococcales bacterium]|nr:B12-binding domain-containing radical SAM protein [Magnetococcales bacterium]
MKILLIYPSVLDAYGLAKKFRRAYMPPLSLAILQSLTPRHHEVRIVNDVVEPVDFDIDVDLVGITAMTTQIGRAYQIADAFRRRHVQVVIGGIHATLLPEEAGRHADAVVVGEAEDVWETVLHHAGQNRLQPLYQCNHRPDLSRRVAPDWRGMDLGIYMLGRDGLPVMPIFTTRGCPIGCDFCSVTTSSGTAIRSKPVDHVIEEINALPKAQNYFFVDDTIDMRPDYARELFKGLQWNRRQKEIDWMSQATTTIYRKPDLLNLAFASGCNQLFIGMESIGAQALDSVGKSCNNVEHYDELFTALNTFKILGTASLIFGFDEDTESTVRETIAYFSHRPTMNVICWLLTPLPGTVLFQRMLSQGRLFHQDWSRYDLNHVVFQPRHFSPEALETLYWNLFAELFSPDMIRKRTATLKSIGYRNVEAFHFLQRYNVTLVKQRMHPYSAGFLPLRIINSRKPLTVC